MFFRLPLLLTLFTLILVNNIFGIVPFVQFPTFSRLGFPLVLTLIVYVVYHAVALKRKHGVVGYMMSEYMVENEHILSDLTNDTVQRMYKAFNATNDERFWMAGIGCAVAAGILWSQKHIGAIDLPGSILIHPPIRCPGVIARSRISMISRCYCSK